MEIDGNKLRYMRRKKNLTQEELGDKLAKLTKTTISGWETGQHPVDPQYHDKLCFILNCDLREISTDESVAISENSKNPFALVNHDSFVRTREDALRDQACEKVEDAAMREGSWKWRVRCLEEEKYIIEKAKFDLESQMEKLRLENKVLQLEKRLSELGDAKEKRGKDDDKD